MASQKVFGSYQEIIDLHTEANHVSAIGIHTPTGDTPRKMFKGYFDQYKKYKYLGASITLVPAARLPADPMGISYNSTGQVAGTEMDPRDALNPIMFHGCHGDDMGSILNTLYGNDSSISDSLDGLDGGAVSITDFVGASLWINMERLYYKALTDKTWKKANPMSGFKKGNLRPLVYSLATNRQIMPYEGSPANIGALTQGGDPTTQIVEDDDELWAPARANNLQFFTPRLTRLGWMETRNVHAIAKTGIPGIESADDIPEFIAQALDTTTTPAEMPKIYMGIILLAPAYGVEQYYRMIVNHRFAFKEFRGISFMPATDGVPAYTNANPDLFNGDQYEDWNSAEGGEVDPPEPGPIGDTAVLTGADSLSETYSVYTTNGYASVKTVYRYLTLGSTTYDGHVFAGEKNNFWFFTDDDKIGIIFIPSSGLARALTTTNGGSGWHVPSSGNHPYDIDEFSTTTWATQPTAWTAADIAVMDSMVAMNHEFTDITIGE